MGTILKNWFFAPKENFGGIKITVIKLISLSVLQGTSGHFLGVPFFGTFHFYSVKNLDKVVNSQWYCATRNSVNINFLF